MWSEMQDRLIASHYVTWEDGSLGKGGLLCDPGCISGLWPREKCVKKKVRA